MGDDAEGPLSVRPDLNRATKSVEDESRADSGRWGLEVR